MTDEPKVPARNPDGTFPKGVSGNPAGRVKGTKNRITMARLMLEETLRESLTAAGPKLLRKAIKMALSGDDKVMRALLDKMLATPRGDDETGTGDRDIRIVLQNFTGPQAQLPAIDGTVVRHAIEGQSTQHEQPQRPAPERLGAHRDGEVVRATVRERDAGPGAGKASPAARELDQER